MADTFNYTRLGQANFTGDVEALFKDQFCPMLLTAFDEKRVAKNYVRAKTITKGKSASFPALGTTGAKYVNVGDTLLGNQTIAHNEISIKVDPFLVSDLLIAEFDKKLQEYDDSSEIATEMGRALANKEDKQLLQVGVLAARADGIVQGRAGGSVIKAGATVETDAATLISALFTAGVELDTKDVPEEDRACFIRPLQYAMLCQYEPVISSLTGGGSFEKGKTGLIGNLNIIKTNHLPNTNIAKETGAVPNNVYYGDFTDTVALVMNRQAIGTVTLQGVITETKWMLERLAHLLTARVLQGHGILRPEAAVEISKASATVTTPTTPTTPST